ncbi:phosphatase PAP2/dual specificity phosphatase family protein [Paralysiella testudinis]|uniref:Phosphatase PAP2/dual specificity phosphatase family protein n=1 Tax=Paralysiella testudinis TaxID=2809020 RepID=A0A892ZGE2_9NEIS|nr:phosphatase PAP2/dual specificity phosphatase family protein [Paralysiella testudinis]QRQ82181.1 phosphatase PAP2/dual specificity phosphatase family protein [Paralysiella testudinis]
MSTADSPSDLSKKHALMCLLAMGVLFYSSYGLANWLAAQQGGVPEMAFAWERQIPFWAWTIVPYWSLNLCYAAAFFVAKSRAELYRYIAQLVCAQAIAIVCFVLWPLQYTWLKPDVGGVSGWLFASLAVFDQPYNQAPSLHIILTMVVGRFYWSRLPERWRGLWLAWLLLIGLSVLTTYQHHFIDIPTGVLVGALLWWAFPTHGATPLRFRQPVYPRWLALYLGLAVVFTAAALWGGVSAWLWLFWPVAACLLLAAAYGGLGAAALQKQVHGRLSPAAALLLLPYLVAVRLNMAYWLRGVPASVVVADRLHIGSITAAARFEAVVDVCAEYPLFRQPSYYHAQPMLDMVAPPPADLQAAAAAVEQARQQGRTVLVCCALGYGRSAAVVLLWLVRYGHCADLAAAIAVLKQARPQMVLPAATRRHIEQALRLPESI